MRRFVSPIMATLLSLLFLFTASPAQTQDFPKQPLRLVIGFPPGGVNDILARILSNGLGKLLGQSVLAENKPGAGGLIATEYVARQVPADGHTVLITSVNLPTYPVFNKMTFDPIKDLKHISILAEGPLVLWVNVQTPINNWQEFVAYARANPGKLNMAAPGAQSSPAMFMEGIKQRMGIDVVIVPFKGTADGLAAVLGNQVQLQINDSATAIRQATDGKGRPLAQTGTARMAELPNVPTVTELGMPDAIIPFWVGMAVPLATPPAVVDRLFASVRETMATAEARDLLGKGRLFVIASNPEATLKRIVAEHAYFAGVAAKAGIRPQ